MNEILKLLAEVLKKLDALTARVDRYYTRMDADRWITTETGAHIKLNEAGQVIGGAGGKLNGQYYGEDKSGSGGVDKSGDTRYNKNVSTTTKSGEHKMKSLFGSKKSSTEKKLSEPQVAVLSAVKELQCKPDINNISWLRQKSLIDGNQLDWDEFEAAIKSLKNAGKIIEDSSGKFNLVAGE